MYSQTFWKYTLARLFWWDTGSLFNKGTSKGDEVHLCQAPTMCLELAQCLWHPTNEVSRVGCLAHSFGSEDWLGILIPSSTCFQRNQRNHKIHKPTTQIFKIPFIVIAPQNSQNIEFSEFSSIYISHCFDREFLDLSVVKFICSSLAALACTHAANLARRSAVKATNTISQRCLAPALCILVFSHVVLGIDFYPCIHDINMIYNCINIIIIYIYYLYIYDICMFRSDSWFNSYQFMFYLYSKQIDPNTFEVQHTSEYCIKMQSVPLQSVLGPVTGAQAHWLNLRQ